MSEWVEREDLAASNVAPDGGERVGRLHGLRAGGDECPKTGGRTAGTAALATIRIQERAGGEQQLLAGDDVDRDDVQRNRQILELTAAEVIGDEPAQAGIGDEMGARPEKTEPPKRARSMPTWIAPSPAPAERTNATGDD